MPTPEVEIEKTLEEASSSLTLVLSREQRKLIVTYLNLLAARNQNVNLVANADFSYVLKHHVLDCLTVAEVMAAQAGYETAHAIDLGSGAGFPGLIVAVALPDIR